MGQEEKKIYAQIFQLALMLSEHSEYAPFARDAIDSLTKEIKVKPKETFDYCWEILKEYADIKNTDEGRWEELIKQKSDEFCENKDKFTLRMVGGVIKELERRSLK